MQRACGTFYSAAGDTGNFTIAKVNQFVGECLVSRLHGNDTWSGNP